MSKRNRKPIWVRMMSDKKMLEWTVDFFILSKLRGEPDPNKFPGHPDQLLVAKSLECYQNTMKFSDKDLVDAYTSGHKSFYLMAALELLWRELLPGVEIKKDSKLQELFDYALDIHEIIAGYSADPAWFARAQQTFLEDYRTSTVPLF